jgi:hypothetical protein
VVALGCNAAGEGGQRDGRNGRRSVAKLSSVLLQNGGKGSGAGGPVWECPRGGGGNKGGPGTSGARSNGRYGQPNSGGCGQLPVMWNQGR